MNIKIIILFLLCFLTKDILSTDLSTEMNKIVSIMLNNNNSKHTPIYELVALNIFNKCYNTHQALADLFKDPEIRDDFGENTWHGQSGSQQRKKYIEFLNGINTKRTIPTYNDEIIKKNPQFKKIIDFIQNNTLWYVHRQMEIEKKLITIMIEKGEKIMPKNFGEEKEKYFKDYIEQINSNQYFKEYNNLGIRLASQSLQRIFLVLSFKKSGSFDLMNIQVNHEIAQYLIEKIVPYI